MLLKQIILTLKTFSNLLECCSGFNLYRSHININGFEFNWKAWFDLRVCLDFFSPSIIQDYANC